MRLLRIFLIGFSGLLSLALSAKPLAADEAAPAAVSPAASNESKGDTLPAASELDAVVVKAKGLSQAAAFNQMHDSFNKVNVLSKDQIDQTPAKTVAQAVQQLPGVGVQHDEGEPIFMQIRGTDQNLNVITFNNTLIPSFVPSERAVQINDIPVGVVSNMELFKTILPNMDAQGIGGQLNLVPRSAFDYPKGLIEANVEGGYAPIHGDPRYAGNLSWADTYNLGGTRKLGLLVTGETDAMTFGIDDLEADYSSAAGVAAASPKSINDYSFRRYSFERQRAGVGTNIDYQTDPDNKYFVNFFGSGYDEWRDPKLVTIFNGLDVTSAGQINADGSFTVTPPSKKAIQDELTHVLTLDRTWAAVAGGHNKFDGFELGYKASYAYASEAEPDDYKYVFNSAKNSIGGSITYNNSGNNGDSPSFDTSKLTGWNANNMVFSKAENGPSNTITNQYGLQVDGQADRFLGDTGGTLKFGAAARFSYATYGQTSLENDAAGPALTENQVLGSAYTYYPGSIYSTGPTIGTQVYGFDLSPYTGGWYQSDPVADLAADWGSRENIYAGFAMFTQTVGKLTVLGGARVESTDIHYDWNMGYDALGNELASATPESGTIRYTNVLPSLGIKYDFDPTLTSRLNYSQTLARPTYAEYIPSIGQQDTVPGTDPNGGNNTVVGNPDLNAMLSNNIDFSAEYYPMKGSIIAVDAFLKDIDNYFTSTYYLVDSGAGSVVTFANIPYSQVYGLELQYQQQFSFLPGPFAGLGLRGAIDRNWSHGQTTPGQADTSLPSQADLVWNAGVFYKLDHWTFDIGCDFTGHNLYLVGDADPNHAGGTGAVPNIWYDDYFQIDAKLQFAFNRNFKVYVNGNNLNNAPLRFYEDPGSNYPIQCEYYGPSFNAGLTYNY